MKKFLLKGKELLSKKLQQFDIEPVTIDYVGEQTPTRLKQSLSVLRDNEIDLEDNAEYETYFKNYPNHHVSHYLLDKSKPQKPNPSLNSPNTLPSIPYLPPQNPNTYIPPFNTPLQSKSLQFKSSVQQYEQGFNKIQQPLLCICVVHFHHKRGVEIQYQYPSQKGLEVMAAEVVHHAMPDSSHLRDQDWNFFNFQVGGQGGEGSGRKRMMFGVSYFKQIKVTEEMKKNNLELTRSHAQKAVAIITTLPLFQYLKLRLQNTTQLFFQNFTNFQIIHQAYLNINQNLTESWPNIQLPDLYMGCDLKNIVQKFGISNLYQIWKALVYQKRVVVFAQTSSDASSFILGVLSLFPGLSAFGVCSRPISRYLQSLREYSLPLRMFSSKNFLSISFHVQDFWQLARFAKNDQGNFLLGTTNRLLKQSNQYGIEMLVNLEQGTITKNKPRRPWQPLTKKQKNFISDLKQSYQTLQNDQSRKIDDAIRNAFHQFLKSALVDMILGIRQYQNFVTQCQKYQKSMKKTQKGQIKKDHSYQLMQDEQQDPNKNDQSSSTSEYAPTFPTSTNQIILPQLLLNKSFAYFRQFHNSNLPQIIKGSITPSIYINNYQYYFRLNPQQFIFYNWLQKKLIFGKGTLMNCDAKQIKFKASANLEIVQVFDQGRNKDMTRSIYIGMIQGGRYTRNGFYVDKCQYYQGEFQDGFKHGYGKFSNRFEKYIGNFQNNLYDGEGQLVKDGSVYVGNFKQGLKNGYGDIQGAQNYAGQWFNDNPVPDDFFLKTEKQNVKKAERKGSAAESKKN